jgi:hypothetical protein
MEERRAVRALVLEVDGSPRKAARLLADRFPDVAREERGLRLAIGAGRTPEAVLAYCRERGIGVRASRVRIRPGDGAAAPSGASASPSLREVVR